MVGVPFTTVKLMVSQRNVTPAALGISVPKASSTTIVRVNRITNLKLDFTMHLLIKGSLKGNPAKIFLAKGDARKLTRRPFKLAVPRSALPSNYRFR
jgi:hypothetical protein